MELHRSITTIWFFSLLLSFLFQKKKPIRSPKQRRVKQARFSPETRSAIRWHKGGGLAEGRRGGRGDSLGDFDRIDLHRFVFVFSAGVGCCCRFCFCCRPGAHSLRLLEEDKKRRLNSTKWGARGVFSLHKKKKKVSSLSLSLSTSFAFFLLLLLIV